MRSQGPLHKELSPVHTASGVSTLFRLQILLTLQVAGMGDKDSAGEPGMSDQLHVQQEWEQVCPLCVLNICDSDSASQLFSVQCWMCCGNGILVSCAVSVGLSMYLGDERVVAQTNAQGSGAMPAG